MTHLCVYVESPKDVVLFYGQNKKWRRRIILHDGIMTENGSFIPKMMLQVSRIT